MKEIRQNHLIADLPKWLFILCLFILPMEAANSIEVWDGRRPDNDIWFFLFLWLLGFIILYFSLYRLLLKNLVRQEVHPHILANTLILFCVGGFLLVSFWLLAQDIGLGWFALIASLYICVLLMLVFLGKALRPLIFFLVIMAAIVAFRLLNI